MKLTTRQEATRGQPRFSRGENGTVAVSNRKSVTYQTAVVTGAASGIGRALCPLLGEQGARLILIDRDAHGLRSLAAELATAGVRSATAAVDVTRPDELKQAIGGLTEQTGPVDLLVASAGITGATLVDQLQIEQAEEIARVNFFGTVYAIDAVLPGMLDRRKGHIVGVSSLAGCRGMPFSAAYSASKAALSKYLESLRPSLRKRGVQVTTVCPGFVRTPLMESAPLKPPVRMLEPERAARYILHAIVRRRRQCSFPLGISLGVRLLTWMPAGVYDWMMSRAARKIPNLTY